MATKISPATKRLALEKLKEGLSVKDVADLTGVSTRTLDRWKGKPDAKVAVPGRSAPLATAPPTEPSPLEDKTTLDFEDAPAPVEKKSVVDSALSSLKGMLGIADKKDAAKNTQPVFSAKLDAKRQQFVDSFSPTVALGFMALAAWLWGHIGPEYSALAPDEVVAAKIVTPLLRIYARHASFIADVNPDVADVGASMFALVAYVNVSLKIYQHIKQEQEEADEIDEFSTRRHRTSTAENGVGNTSNGYAAVRGRSGGNGQGNGEHDGHTGGVDLSHLSNKEAQQHAALSRLAELDYSSRLRRSGRA